MHTCIHGTNAHVYMTTYNYIYVHIYIYINICQGAADSAHILRLSTAASFPRRATKVQSGEICMNSQALQSESENRWSHRLGLLGLVM